MRDEFAGYYPPSKEEFKKLWEEGTIVLDTNVLLNLYRLPATARSEFISLLQELKDRLWIPFQVALEFQRNRLSVIAGERKSTEKALETTKSLFQDVLTSLSDLELDKRGIGKDTEHLLKNFEDAQAELLKAVQSAHDAQIDIASDDEVRDQIDELLKGRVGPKPADQASVDLLCADHNSRYDKSIPPGYMDRPKDDADDSDIFFDGISFKKSAGDLIVWRQIINYAREKDLKSILFITSDRKEDWWWREKGRTIGPRPELTREINRESGVDLFWMYSSDQFLQNGSTFTKSKISENSVSAVREVIRNALDLDKFENTSQNALLRYASAESPYPARNALSHYSYENSSNLSRRLQFMENGIASYLRNKYDANVEANREFPDFTVYREYGAHGYEVKYVRNFEKLLVPPAVVHAMLRGYLEVHEGNLSNFSMVIVVDEESYEGLMDTGREVKIEPRLRALLERYPIHSIVLAIAGSQDEYVEVLKEFVNSR